MQPHFTVSLFENYEYSDYGPMSRMIAYKFFTVSGVGLSKINNFGLTGVRIWQNYLSMRTICAYLNFKGFEYLSIKILMCPPSRGAFVSSKNIDKNCVRPNIL